MAKKVEVDVIVAEKGGGLAKVTKSGKEAHGALERTRKEGERYREAQGSIAGATSNSTKAFSKQAQGLGGLVHAYATVAANAFALTAAFGALQRAADLSVLKASMEIMDQASGTNLAGMAKALKEVTAGMLTFEEAAKQAAIVSSAGFGRKELVALGKAARGASQALGRDFGDSMDRLVRGVIKAEPELLDELGIILRLDDAAEKYAKTLNKSKNELTTYEKQISVLNEVLDQSTDKYGDVIKAQSTVNQFTKLQATFMEELHGALQVVNNVLQPMAGFLADNIEVLNVFMALGLIKLSRMAIPLMGELGKVTEKWGINAAAAAEAAAGRQSDLVAKTKRLAETQKDLTTNAGAAGDALKKATKSMIEQGKGSKMLAAGLAENLTGPEFAKKFERSLKTSIRQAYDNVGDDGTITRGMFAKQSKAQVEAFEKNFVQAIDNTAAASRRSLESIKNSALLGVSQIRSRVTGIQENVAKGAATFFDSFRMADQQMASVGIIRAFKEMPQTIAAARGVAVSTLETIEVAAARTAVAVKAIGTAFLKILNIFAIGFIAFEAFNFLSDLFKSAEDKALERGLEKIKGSLEEIQSSSLKFTNTLDKAYGMQDSSLRGALKQAELIKNAYTQINDTFSDTTGNLDIIVANLRQNVRKIADEIENMPDVNRIDRARSQTVGTGLRRELGAAQEEAATLGADYLQGVQEFLNRNPLQTNEFLGDANESIAATIKAIRDGVGEKGILTDAALEALKAYSSALKAAQFEANALFEAVQKIGKGSSELPRSLGKLLVSDPNELDKMGNVIQDMQKNFEELTRNSEKTPENITASANAARNMLKFFGASEETLIGVVEAGGNFNVVSAQLGDEWEKFRKILEQAKGTIGTMESSLLTSKTSVSSLTSLYTKLSLAQARDDDAAQSKSAIAKLNLEIFNEEVKVTENSVRLRKEEIQSMSRLAKNAGEKYNFAQQELSLQDDLIGTLRQMVSESEVLDAQGKALALASLQRLENENKISKALAEQAENMRMLQGLRAGSDQASGTAGELDVLGMEAKLAQFTRAAANLRRDAIGMGAGGLVREAQGTESELQKLTQALKLKSIIDERNEAEREYNRIVADGFANKGFVDSQALQMQKLRDTTILAEEKMRNFSITSTAAIEDLAETQRQELLDFPNTFAEAWETAAEKMKEDTKDLGNIMQEALISSADQFSGSLANMAINADFSADSFRRMAASIITDIGRMIAKQLILNGIQGIMSGGFGGGGLNANGQNLGLFGQVTAPTTSFQASRFATGGIVNKPTLALAGEAGMNEAFVPLPDGKTIPVTMNNGSSSENTNNNVVVNVNMTDSGATSQEEGNGKELGKLISVAIQRELVEQQRPGGMLSRRR